MLRPFSLKCGHTVLLGPRDYWLTYVKEPCPTCMVDDRLCPVPKR